MKHGLYEQVINQEISAQLAQDETSVSKIAEIDKAEAAKVLSQYLSEVVEQGLSRHPKQPICT